MPQTQIHLVRHAESAHNVSKDFSLRDPGLTALGIEQSKAAFQTYPFIVENRKVRVVVTSPLRRAVQTTLYAFSDLLDKKYYVGFDDGEGGVENGVELRVDARLQERSDLPCDTGSEREALEGEFPGLDFSPLPTSYPSKTAEALYAANDEAVSARAAAVTSSLKEIIDSGDDGKGKGDVIVVTHGVFMKFLSGDQSIDLPKAGARSFIFAEKKGEGEELVAV